MDECLNAWKRGRMDRGIVEWIDRWMDYHMDGMLDRCMQACSDE